MKLLRILIILLMFSIAGAEYIAGDFVDNIVFTDSNVDSLGNIVYSTQSTKDIISSGRIVVLSFFSPG
ncbi:MAG: hypothetical protein JXN63_05480 [Candidatus Delongbacteria bacterium]|nr:hypothetical protein [Candidatus Delongbacteria bacterium]